MAGTLGARLTINTPGSKGSKGSKGGSKGPNYNSPLYNPSQQLSGQQLARAASQIANVQTQPVINGYQGQIKQNNQNTANESRTDFGYYMQLAQDAKNLVAQQQQGNADLQTQLQGIAGSTQGQLSALGQQYQGGALGRLSALGLGGDSQAQLAAQTAQAQGVATQNAGASQTYGAMTGANDLAADRQLGATGGLAGTQAISALQRGNTIANQPIEQKISDTIASKGALTATALGQLRTAERNYQIAQAGVDLKKTDLAATVKQQGVVDKQRDQALAQSGASIKLRSDLQAYNTDPNYIGSPAWSRVQSQTGTKWSNDPNAVGSAAWARVQAANARTAAAGGRGAPKALTNNENNQWFRSLGQVEALAKSMQAPLNAAAAKRLGLNQGVVLTGAQINSYLQAGNNPAGKAFDPVMIQAATELATNGTITPQTAAAMHSMGLRHGTYQQSPISVQAAPVGNPVAPRPGTKNTLVPGSLGF